MEIHVIGNRGVVGGATEKVLSMCEAHEVSGSDKGENIPQFADINLICVPEKNVPEIVEEIKHYKGLCVIRSTLSPSVVITLKKTLTIPFCTNPEFLKAHTAFWDCYFPKGILIGSSNEEAGKRVEEMWSFLNVPIFHTSQEQASMIKILSNVHAAMLISFWNYAKVINDALQINTTTISRLLPNLDERVSKYGTIPGSAYGGTCLPKDVEQLLTLCEENNLNTDFLEALKEINSWYSEIGISRGGL